MAQQTIGIDISDELLSGVVVSRKGRDIRVVDCATVAINDKTDITDQLSALVEQLHWRGEDCVSGISLSHFSLRNLCLPFTSEKKIEQILPFELEEHLLVPVSEQVFSAITTSQNDDGSHLLVAAIEKEFLRHHLDTLKNAGVEPAKVCMSCFVLADYLCEAGRDGQDFLLLYGDLGSMTLVVCHQKKIVFMRRLSYPEAVFTDAVFSFNGQEVSIADQETADTAVHSLCTIIQQSLERFVAASGMDLKPDHVILAGPMQLAAGFREIVEQELGLPCNVANLRMSGAATLVKDVGEKWIPALFDRPLSLALQGENRKISFDFRKDEFALPSHLLGSKKQMFALALAAGLLLAVSFGYLFFDYNSLKIQHNNLADQMKQVFKASFPEATRVVDPLAQMRARLQEVQAPTVSMPLYTQEQRILAILADISSRIPDSISMHVSRLVIDEDTVRIKGTTDAFNNVNTIKKLLADSVRYLDVAIVSATKSKEKNAIRFEIRLQLEENS